MIEDIEYEEMPVSTIEDTIEKKREKPWTLEEFLPVFEQMELQEENGSHSKHSTIQTGMFVVNGVQRVQTQEQVLKFTFDPEMNASVDGSMLAGIDVEIYSSSDSEKHTFLKELIYCTPDDFPSIYRMYTSRR